MEGVGTSTAGFIGLAERGPAEGVPQLVTNFADFKRKFGGYLSENEYGEYRFLAYAVEHFFVNGGSRCYISRVAPSDAKPAHAKVPAMESVLRVRAKNPGLWGNSMSVVVTPSSKAKTQILEELDTADGKQYSVKSSAGFHPGDVVVYKDMTNVVYNRVVKSQDNIIVFEKEFEQDVVDKNREPVAPFDEIAGEDPEKAFCVIPLKGGSNGSVSNISAADFIGVDKGAGKRTGIQAFLDNDNVSIMAVPGVVDPNVQLMLVAHCENLASRFAVLDMPRNAKKMDDIIAHREIVDSNYAAMYHPWLEVFDPLDKKNMAIPPSGSVIGIYARSDNSRGVHKAPANETVRACVGLDCQFNKGEQDILNPKGVNLIRSFPGQGIRVWGARTASSDPSWKYINVRRLFIFIEESIKANTNWAVFEPNDEVLWVRVKRTIDVFLTGLWRSGALAGSAPSDAFFVNCGRNTMSQDDIDNGRLICVIGVAPVKPAEFVIFRISQKTGDSV